MRSALFLVLLIPLFLSSVRAAEDEVRILFVGNSYSFQVPKVLGKLAESKGKSVVIEQVTKGGWTLAKHADAKATREKIAGAKWDFVVLQEQSQIPSFPDAEKRMGAAVKALGKLAVESGAELLLFETWGRRDGDKRNREDDTFADMQKRLTKGYAAAAKKSGGDVVPVGTIWAKLVRDDFYKKDGSHPSKMGDYLAACVFYAAVFDESPEGAEFLDGIEAEMAVEIHKAAAGAAKKR